MCEDKMKNATRCVAFFVGCCLCGLAEVLDRTFWTKAPEGDRSGAGDVSLRKAHFD